MCPIFGQSGTSYSNGRPLLPNHRKHVTMNTGRLPTTPSAMRGGYYTGSGFRSYPGGSIVYPAQSVGDDMAVPATAIKNDVLGLPRVGSALKTDPHHAFPDIVDNYAGYATRFPKVNGTLYQIKGSLNGKSGRFEWVVENQKIVHRFFVEGGDINGRSSKP